MHLSNPPESGPDRSGGNSHSSARSWRITISHTRTGSRDPSGGGAREGEHDRDEGGSSEGCRGAAHSGVCCRVYAVAPQLPRARLRHPLRRSVSGMAGAARQCAIAVLWEGPAAADTPTLIQCLPWGPFLRTWTQVARQHDAAEFLMRFLQLAQPPAYTGTWQARLSNPDEVTQAGPLLAPILMAVRGPHCRTS